MRRLAARNPDTSGRQLRRIDRRRLEGARRTEQTRASKLSMMLSYYRERDLRAQLARGNFRCVARTFIIDGQVEPATNLALARLAVAARPGSLIVESSGSCRFSRWWFARYNYQLSFCTQDEARWAVWMAARMRGRGVQLELRPAKTYVRVSCLEDDPVWLAGTLWAAVDLVTLDRAVRGRMRMPDWWTDPTTKRLATLRDLVAARCAAWEADRQAEYARTFHLM